MASPSQASRRPERIQDNDSFVVVTGISDATQADGTDLVHVVTLSGATAVAQDFAFALSDITTTAADYGTTTFSDGVTLNGSTLTIPIGASSFNVTVSGADDLLDEATSALDTRTERAMSQALDGLSKVRTTITIKHRLSTIREADLVVVMQRGRVVANGKHAALAAQGGVYAGLLAGA
ncbi:hypothetical protein [Sagittula stellata]|uniref:ABC transporter ATP-binding protein n=1 Tax=Sagittula stellata (strain ATCC 700073 / DSM 11524 / E-37) TaxID=388399 RepID=A3K4V5_SAGS3|nr:ABC transporter ATP-binding protein [Sagittula stellata E-37]